MRKTKIARVAGFTLAAGATATLVGFAATGTGAYFSAASSGNIAASTGSVTVTSSPNNLDFTNSLPGVFKTQKVSYSVNGSGPEDVYIAFDQPGDNRINGFSSDSNPDALGRYGHLEVDGPQGTFTSYNLSTDKSQTVRGTVSGDPTADCYEDPNTGLGGSSDQATRADDPASPGNGAVSYVNSCPAPRYILLSKGLQASDGTQSANITFGYTKILDNNAQQASGPDTIPFRIVAEQAGVSPYDPNTTNGN
jgi:hypothetical protein